MNAGVRAETIHMHPGCTHTKANGFMTSESQQKKGNRTFQKEPDVASVYSVQTTKRQPATYVRTKEIAWPWNDQ